MKELPVKNIISQLRSEKGLTQEHLAKQVGVSRQTIIAIERGNYTPSVALAMRLADFFETSVEKIFSFEYEK